MSWYKFSPLNGIRVKPKLHRRLTRIYDSLQKPSPKPKVSHTDNSRIFMELSKQLHFIDQKLAELQNKLHVEQKKRHQPYYCNVDRMISGGRILWNAIAVCEMTKTSWQTGNVKMNEDLENPSGTCFVRGENLGRRYSDC